MNEVWVQPQVRPLIKNKKPTRQKTKQVGDWETGIEDTVHYELQMALCPWMVYVM